MDENKILDFAQIAALPSADEAEAERLFDREAEGFRSKIVVLDDDPTGIQTVHGIQVYTGWGKEQMREGFADEKQMFYILTNSRSFSKKETISVHREIAEAVASAAGADNDAGGRDFLLISRGDSTLRGHYPTETQILRETLEEKLPIRYDGEVLCPFFLEGGRYTINGIHYVKEEDRLVPAALTEFAGDRTFPFTHSDLGAYVEEKSAGLYPAESCIRITIDELRRLDVEGITAKLLRAEHFRKILVDAAAYADVKVFAAAFLRAMKAGRHFLVRSAAAFPKVIGRVPDRPLLTAADLRISGSYGGLVIVGSHVNKTTRQLDALRAAGMPATFIEFRVNAWFEPDGLKKETVRAAEEAQKAMAAGRTAVVYTSRQLLNPGQADEEQLLRASVEISDALTAVAACLPRKPRFLVAKGGITSSDVGTKALQVKKACVAGQIMPGIPVWLTGEESRFPGLPYVIFPGNVGGTETLKEIVEKLGVLLCVR